MADKKALVVDKWQKKNHFIQSTFVIFYRKTMWGLSLDFLMIAHQLKSSVLWVSPCCDNPKSLQHIVRKWARMEWNKEMFWSNNILVCLILIENPTEDLFCGFSARDAPIWIGYQSRYEQKNGLRITKKYKSMDWLASFKLMTTRNATLPV